MTGSDGYIKKIKNVDELADKMIYLYENKHIISDMACSGRKMVEEKI